MADGAVALDTPPRARPGDEVATSRPVHPMSCRFRSMSCRLFSRAAVRHLVVPIALLLPAAARGEPPRPSPRSERTSFRPGELWLDDRSVHINAHGGGILDFEGRYYWFGEHKVEGEAGNTAQVGVHCYSSHDLYNWKDEGIVLPVVKDDPDHDLAVGSIVERPKVIHNRKTGKFVMWFHLERKGTGTREESFRTSRTA